MRKRINVLCFVILLLTLMTSVSFAKDFYNITYDYGVADVRSDTIINSNPKSFTNNDVIKLKAPECPGFEFKGWYLDNNYKKQVTTVDTSKASDITLYAKWYEMTYSINYVLETPGIEISKNEISNQNPLSHLSSETTYLSAPVCDSDFYTFDGWYFDSNYTKKADYIPEYTCKDITLYAKWKNTSYSIFYELGDVTNSVYTTNNSNPEKYEYNNELVLSEAVTKDPTYTFDGWYSDEFFTNKITSVKKGTHGDIILYAKWNKAVFGINYVLTDNSGINAEKIHNNNPDTHTSGTELVLNNLISDDKSLAFDGWYTSPSFSNDSRITSIDSDFYKDITIYAKWKKAVYNITYDYGDISLLYCPIVNNNPETYEYGANIKLEAVTADGFIFNGWCADKKLKNKITSIPENSFGDITIYADFTEKTYSVSYVLEGNDVKASQVVNLNPSIRTTSQQVSLVPAETINTEYKFAGWYLDKEFKKDIEYIKAYTTGNITLYAKWIKAVVYLPCWGDASLSDELSAADARLILRYSAGLEKGFNELQKKVSDINNDKKITAADARLALRMSAFVDNPESIIEKYSLPTIKVVDGEVVFE